MTQRVPHYCYFPQRDPRSGQWLRDARRAVFDAQGTQVGMLVQITGSQFEIRQGHTVVGDLREFSQVRRALEQLAPQGSIAA